jgi:hypothetical protein
MVGEDQSGSACGCGLLSCCRAGWVEMGWDGTGQDGKSSECESVHVKSSPVKSKSGRACTSSQVQSRVRVGERARDARTRRLAKESHVRRSAAKASDVVPNPLHRPQHIRTHTMSAQATAHTKSAGHSTYEECSQALAKPNTHSKSAVRRRGDGLVEVGGSWSPQRALATPRPHRTCRSCRRCLRRGSRTAARSRARPDGTRR